VELLNKIITSRKIDVLYPGCAPVASLPRTRGDYILAVTKWDMGKRPSILLEVLERICRARLIVAGNWVQQSTLDTFLKKVKRKGLTEQVEVLGPTDQKTLRELYLGANVLIHPIFEAFGMIALEAASHGCPFIIPKRSGVTDLFTHGIHGFFPTEGDIDEYANYVQALISDKLLAWKMGHDAWEVSKKYTWKDHTIRLEKIITRCM
jgi:glycosyltransferase involved in cell wall biosynthesis